MALPLIFGLLLSAATLVVTTVLGFADLSALLSLPSAILVVGTTLAAGLAPYSQRELRQVPGAITRAFKEQVPPDDRTVDLLLELAETYRRGGKSALENMRSDGLGDEALDAGVELIVNGLDTDQIEEAFEHYFHELEARHRIGISLFQGLAGYAPTFGMVGTVIGLVSMLGNLDDPSELGAGLALAMLTTLYGVLLANTLFTPIAARLLRLNEQEIAREPLLIFGFCALRSGTSPILLLPRLEAFLPPYERRGDARLDDLRAARSSSGTRPTQAET